MMDLLVMDRGNDLQIYRVAVNVLNKQLLMRGGPLTLELAGEGD
jgi:hypothetical protein